MIRSYSSIHPPGRVLLPTEPGWDHLVLAGSGIVTAHTPAHAWTIPVHRALCVPDGTRLRIETSRRTLIRCLYARTDLGLVHNQVQVTNLNPLTNELITHAIDSAPLTRKDPTAAALITLIADQLARQPNTALQLPMPSDPAPIALANAILAAPALSLDDHLRSATASRRTLERNFKAQTKMSLGSWRRRARILAAVAMLAEGDSVTSVGFGVGYGSASSFIAAFGAELGATPGEFMRRQP